MYCFSGGSPYRRAISDYRGNAGVEVIISVILLLYKLNDDWSFGALEPNIDVFRCLELRP